MKNHKIAKNSTTTQAREKISTELESLEFLNVCLTKFKNNQILYNKISHRFLLKPKLFTGRKSLVYTQKSFIGLGLESCSNQTFL